MTNKAALLMPELAIMRAIIAADEPTEVERLEAENERLTTFLLSSSHGQEYERLRAENERLEANRKSARAALELCEQNYERLEAENERLREALEKIVHEACDAGTACEIARAALSKGEKE